MRNADFVFQEVARDWQVKLRDRHAEVCRRVLMPQGAMLDRACSYAQAREVQRRQAAAMQRNAEARAAEEERVVAKGARVQRASAAAEQGAAHDAALLPELEELETAWGSVKRAAGGGDVQEVLHHWQGALLGRRLNTVMAGGIVCMPVCMLLCACVRSNHADRVFVQACSARKSTCRSCCG